MKANRRAMTGKRGRKLHRRTPTTCGSGSRPRSATATLTPISLQDCLQPPLVEADSHYLQGLVLGHWPGTLLPDWHLEGTKSNLQGSTRPVPLSLSSLLSGLEAERSCTSTPPPAEWIPAEDSDSSKVSVKTIRACGRAVTRPAVLGRMGPAAAEAVPQLLKALEDEVWMVRSDAAEALGKMGPEAAEAVPQLLKALEDEVWIVRQDAAKALSKMGPAAAEAVPQLLKLLEDKDWMVRYNSASVLGTMGPAAAEAVPQLLKLLEDEDEDEYVRRNAAEALGTMGPAATAAVPQLLKLLEDSDAYLRGNSAEALGKMGPAAAEAVPQLLKLLEDEKEIVRSNAARALGEMGPAAAEAVPQLLQALEDEKEIVRSNAARALGEMGPAIAEAVPQLLKALEDEVWMVRSDAAEALGKMGPEAAEAVPHLLKALEDEDEDVCSHAAEALAKIGPADFPLPRVAVVLAKLDARQETHGILLRFLLSHCQDSEDSPHPDLADAVQKVIWFSDRDEVLRCAVKALPWILKSIEFSTFHLRGLVQHALRKVPETVVECNLHQLLETRSACDTMNAAEPAESLLGSSNGLGTISQTGTSCAASARDQRAGYMLSKPSCSDADSAGDCEVPLGWYALQAQNDGATASEVFEGAWAVQRSFFAVMTLGMPGSGRKAGRNCLPGASLCISGESTPSRGLPSFV